MKGLALSEDYFKTFGLPLIENEFNEYKYRIAAGLVGDGSECFGFDDNLSRDHDWGPGFCLFLTGSDYNDIGKKLQIAYESLPQTHEGFRKIESTWGHGRTGVFEISEFYKKFIGVSDIPDSNTTWRCLPEQNLATCTNGKVFYDPLGEFSRWRKTLLDFYPEDIRLKKIAARCMSIAQSGQYNLQRSINRKDLFALRYAEIKFCSDLISLVFLLNKRYAPFYKWMHRALKTLPLLGDEIHIKIDSLITSSVENEKIHIVEDMCKSVIGVLREQGLSDSESDFLLEHGPVIQNKIRDDQLRRIDVWVE